MDPEELVGHHVGRGGVRPSQNAGPIGAGPLRTLVICECCSTRLSGNLGREGCSIPVQIHVQREHF